MASKNQSQAKSGAKTIAATNKSRQGKEDLMQTALDAFPATGEVTYKEWADGLIASGNQNAIQFYRELKKRGLVTASLTVADDGSIVHLIRRGQ